MLRSYYRFIRIFKFLQKYFKSPVTNGIYVNFFNFFTVHFPIFKKLSGKTQLKM